MSPHIVVRILMVCIAAIAAGHCLARPALGQEVDYRGAEWQRTGNPTVPRIRVSREVLDSEDAIVEAVVESGKTPYRYRVDWGDDSKPESGTQTTSPLTLTHRYRQISTFNITLEVSLDGPDQKAIRLGPFPVRMTDDDNETPKLVWELPPPVLRPGEPAVVGWQVSDESGLAFMHVMIEGPEGPIVILDEPEGRFDLTGFGPGVYGVEVRTRDADEDRPDDSLGYMVIEIITITDDLDKDGVLDYLDNCPRVENYEQTDSDGDGSGDACDPCPFYNGASEDSDGDGVGDACDNCRNKHNPDQANTDGDFEGDACDADADNDGLEQRRERRLRTDPLNPDTDGGGVGDGVEFERRSDPLDPDDDEVKLNRFEPRLADDRVLVRLAYGLPDEQVQRLARELGARAVGSQASGVYVFEIGQGSPAQLIERINNLSGPSEGHEHGGNRLAYAVGDYLGDFQGDAPLQKREESETVTVPRWQQGRDRLQVPDDPRFPAQSGFTELLEAWNVATPEKSRPIVIALIDTGLDIGHEDLERNVWRNRNEQRGDGNGDGCPGECQKDDDGDGKADFDDPDVQALLSRGFSRAQAAADDDENGYIDDFNGYDFVNDSPDVTDRHGAGTHVAGVVGAVGNNDTGIAGVLWDARLMPLKVARDDGSADLAAVFDAMRYAGANGADIVLHSYAIPLVNPTEAQIADFRALFGRTETKHLLHIAAAGNYSRDLARKDPGSGLGLLNLASDRGEFVFPVSLGVQTLIAVAAHDESATRLAAFTDVGEGVVTMAAPGVNILSTNPGNAYGYRSGTSQAAAYLAGLSGLLLKHYPQLRGKPTEVVNFLRERSSDFRNPTVITSLYYQFTNPPVLTGTLYDQTAFRFPRGFCGNNTYDADLFDADGDGDLDILEVNGNPGTGPNDVHLYRNDGTGRFTNQSSDLGSAATGLNVLASDQADIDQDGDDDILLASFTPPGPTSNRKNILLINQGNLQAGTEGMFANGSAELPDDFDISRDVRFCNFDGDAFPDILVTNTSDDRVYRNIMTAADKTCLTSATRCLTDMTSSWFTGISAGDGHNSYCFDADDDGDDDILTINLNTAGAAGQNVLLINRIDEAAAGNRFINETGSWNIPLEFDTSHAAAVADVDDDNADGNYGQSGDDIDLVIGRRQFGPAGVAQNNKVLINNGSLFLDQTFGTDGVPAGATDRLPNVIEASTELVLCDIDGDNDPDLLQANGDANYDITVQNRYYRNQTLAGVDAAGEGYFSDITGTIGIPVGYVKQSTDVDCGDIDNDGDIDVLFANYGGCPELYVNNRIETTPVITSIVPAAVVVGEPVVINGTNFGAFQGAVGRVTFGGVDAGTVYHWTDTRITVEVPVGSLVGGTPTPTPKGLQAVVVRSASNKSGAAVNLDIKTFNELSAFDVACECGAVGCTGPCLPADYCPNMSPATGCTFDSRAYRSRDIKDVDFGDVDNDGDLDILDVSSPAAPGAPNDPVAGAGFSPTGCGAPVNFYDRLLLNDGTGQFTDVTGGADGDYETAGDNPLPFFHSFRTYDADFVDLDNDGYLEIFRSDRALCASDPSHLFKNVDTSGDGVPDTTFTGHSVAVPTEDAYWDNLATGDVDGDGDLDLLISHSAATTAEHALLLNDGNGNLTRYNPLLMAPVHSASDDFTLFTDRSHDMYLVDLDNDRDLDIVIGGGNHGFGLENEVLLNRFIETGDLFFETVPIPRATEASLTVSLFAGDMNGDGRRDLHFTNYNAFPDRLFLNLGRVQCGGACGDGLSCPPGLVVDNRICWHDASDDMPEALASSIQPGYGSDYGDIDGDGDLDILVTGLGYAYNYLFVNREYDICTTSADCAGGYSCITGRCRLTSASTSPKWWSCPTLGAGGSAIACKNQAGTTLTGPDFPAAMTPGRDLAVVFGDIDGDVDLDILWGRGQWPNWTKHTDAGPYILINPAGP